jgi:hypothetical protein
MISLRPAAISATEIRSPGEKIAMERVFIGATRAEATRKADEWWKTQKALRQTLRTEMAVVEKEADVAQLDRWAITIHFEDENSNSEPRRE